ncbi:hypothetical protein Ahy_B03g064443 [Arachis hypogaea]|uniref:Uncharacterized protein n=1 Tax=Arachis hypogaea TaxID=3818 RepID=A0A444ZZM3_ARAHY|nr:hypothetical protein Ahy_B03g064443 [Arachis hypogaea]
MLASNKASDVPRTLSRAVSVFSSSAAMFEKLKSDKHSSNENLSQYNKENNAGETEPTNGVGEFLNKLKSTNNHVHHGNGSGSGSQLATVDENSTDDDNGNLEIAALRLSSLQINQLLSSIWVQSISPINLPENYKAIAHTYSLVLLFSRAKIDPFLHLVDDHKLQAFSTACDGSTIYYGSKEDDYRASNLLPELMTLT